MSYQPNQPVYFSDSARAIAQAFRRSQQQPPNQAVSHASGTTQHEDMGGPPNTAPSEAVPGPHRHVPTEVVPIQVADPAGPQAESSKPAIEPQLDPTTLPPTTTGPEDSDEQLGSNRVPNTHRNEPFELFPVAPARHSELVRGTTRSHEHRPFSDTAEIEQAKDSSIQLILPEVRAFDIVTHAGINAILEDARRTNPHVPEPLPPIDQCHTLSVDQVKKVNDFLLRTRLWRMERILEGVPAYISWGATGPVIAESVRSAEISPAADTGNQSATKDDEGKGKQEDEGEYDEIVITGEGRCQDGSGDGSGPSQKRQRRGNTAPWLGEVILLE